MGVLIAVICAVGIGFLNICFAYPFAATVVLLLCSVVRNESFMASACERVHL